jgi:hypothetical protein
MPNYDFKLDLPIAKATEREVADLLVKNYGVEILNYEDTYRYDILARWAVSKMFWEDGKPHYRDVKIEVKEDFVGETTGNVGLEFECRGKPSGIQTTEADYYIYKLHTRSHTIQFVLHDTGVIKQMIEDKLYFRIVNGGDEGSNSMNYLFRYDVFVSTGKVLRTEQDSKVEIAP